MLNPGDVVLARSALAGKHKYHLCVHVGGYFLFLNSYKGRDYEGNLVVECEVIPFIDATETGKSVVCCSSVLRLTEAEIERSKLVGTISKALLLEIYEFIETSDALSPDERELILESLADWV